MKGWVDVFSQLPSPKSSHLIAAFFQMVPLFWRFFSKPEGLFGLPFFAFCFFANTETKWVFLLGYPFLVAFTKTENSGFFGVPLFWLGFF